MVRICMYCKIKMGEKPPLENISETHGVCPSCLRLLNAQIEIREVLKTIDYSTELGLELLYTTYNHVKSLIAEKIFRKNIFEHKSRIKFAEE